MRRRPTIEEPFQKAAIEIVGPVGQASRPGKTYILVDLATNSPRPWLEADPVADVLLAIFSRVGFPQEVLTDQGSNFMWAPLWCLWETHGVRLPWAPA